MKVQAIFDNVDSAEHALFQLRSMGAQPRGYHISRLDHHHTGGEDDLLPLGVMGYENMVSGGNPGTLVGGAWNSLGWGGGMGFDGMTVGQINDGVSREVRLTLECSDDEGAALKGSLVSLHGRQVTTTH